jgi:PAS domain S-box-containing protein
MDQWLFQSNAEKQRPESLRRTIFFIIIVALAYYFIARFCLVFAFQNTNVTAIWPPSGIALAAVWAIGYRVWPGIFIGAFAANASSFLTNSFADLNTVGILSYAIAIGNTLEAVGVCYLLKRFTREFNPLHSVDNVLKFMFITLGVCLINALFGPAVLCLSGKISWQYFSTLWFTWWLGDAAGIFTITPIFFALQQIQFIRWNRARFLEALLVFVAIIAVNLNVFWGGKILVNKPYLLLPIIVWSAYRFGVMGASIASLMTLGIAMAGTIAGFGPFATGDLHTSLLLLLAFVGIISVTGLILAAAVKDRHLALKKAHENEKRFRGLVEHSADMISVVSPTAKILYASPSTRKILGYEPSEYVGRNAFDFIHPEDAGEIKKLLAQVVFNPSKIVEGGCRFRHKDGSWRWMEGTGTNLIADPAIQGIVVNYRDFTDKRKAQEDQLYLAAIIENSDDAIYGKSLDGRITSWNQGAQKIYGYEPMEIVGKSIQTLVPEDRLHEIKKIFEDLKAGKRIKLLETVRRRKDGQLIVVSMRVSPIRDRSGSLIGFSTIARDITERKLAEERYRYIFDGALDAIISIDSTNKIIEWNQQAEKIFGWPRKEVYGKPLTETIIPVSLREAHLKGFNRYLQSGEGPLLNRRIEITALHRDGHEFPVELSITPINLPNGVIFSAFLRDITERKKSEAALRESESRFRKMADTAPVMIWMSGRDTLYNFFSQAWLDFTGQTMERGMGSGWADSIHPDDKQRYQDLYLAAFDHREKFTIEYRLRRWDGDYRWVFDTGVPRFTGNKFEGYIGSCIDITELKLAEDILKRNAETLKKSIEERSKELRKTQEDLRKASRLAEIGTLAATVAHELRNPLGVIQMAAFNLKRRKPELAEDKHLNNIEKKVWEGERVISNLLTYASIKVPNYEAIRALKVLDDCVTAVGVRFHDTEVAIARNYGIEPVFVIEADQVQLTDIFNNILINAYQAFPDKKGSLELTVGIHGGKSVQFLFKDSGMGIEQDDLNKVFTPFFTKKAKGTGLGLAICNELVHLHNGTIEIASEKGKGTTVIVDLPIRQKGAHE